MNCFLILDVNLNIQKDYELLMAIVMSAQTTDKRVNEVNRVLFNRYKSIYDIANADIKDIEKIIKPIGTYKKKRKKYNLLKENC